MGEDIFQGGFPTLPEQDHVGTIDNPQPTGSARLHPTFVQLCFDPFLLRVMDYL